MKLQNKRGFTLIELLVVITIIGILATGWVTVYNGQLQNARDSGRTKAVKSLQSWLELAYQEDSQYPTTASAATIVDKFIWWTGWLKDPSSKSICWDFSTTGWASANQSCQLRYNVWTDLNWATQWAYYAWKAMEKKENAAKDGWILGWVYEIKWWLQPTTAITITASNGVQISN